MFSSRHLDCEKTDYLSKKRKRIRQLDLICGVCGVPALSYHFGAPACSSCRVFFRRAIQNKTFPRFKCESSGRCMINFATERKCQACRFSKCLRNGMDPRWVLNDEERQKLREKWEQSRRIKQNNKKEDISRMMYAPETIKDPSDILREDELATIRSLVDLFRDTVLSVRFQDLLLDCASNVRDCDSAGYCLIARMAMKKVRLVRFANSLPQISKLPYTKREILLKKSLRQMGVLRNAFEAGILRKSSPKDVNIQQYQTIASKYSRTKISDTLLLKYHVFIGSMHKLQLDEPCVLLLIVISLLSSDNIDEMRDECLLDHFTSILYKYVHWRYGSLSVNVVYPKLLALLTEVQELNMTCDERHYWFDEYQLDYLERKLGRLNPFRGYSLERRDKVFSAPTDDCVEITVSDQMPSINMLRRGVISSYHGISDDTLLFVDAFQEQSQSSMEDDASTTTDSTVPDLDLCDIPCGDSPLASWSPDEFDLSWCED